MQHYSSVGRSMKTTFESTQRSKGLLPTHKKEQLIFSNTSRAGLNTPVLNTRLTGGKSANRYVQSALGRTRKAALPSPNI